MEEVLCMCIKEKEEAYKKIIYHEALYSQLEEKHIGAEILWAEEITLEELKSGKYPFVWEQYKREKADEGRALEATDKHEARRLFVNVLDGGIECLIVAKDLDINYDFRRNKLNEKKE